MYIIIFLKMNNIRREINEKDKILMKIKSGRKSQFLEINYSTKKGKKICGFFNN